MGDDYIARELAYLDGVFANPGNRLLFQGGVQVEIERALSTRWSRENRLELLGGLAERFGESAVFAVIDGIIGSKGGETRFRVTECPLASKGRETGAGKWLFHLACLTDEPSATGFNEHIKFSRSHTLMQGHEPCDHCYVETSS